MGGMLRTGLGPSGLLVGRGFAAVAGQWRGLSVTAGLSSEIVDERFPRSVRENPFPVLEGFLNPPSDEPVLDARPTHLLPQPPHMLLYP